MPKRSRKVNRQHKDDSAIEAKTVQLATLKRKKLDEKCKTILSIDSKEGEFNCMKKIKNCQLVFEPDMSSDNELSKVYDLQEEKKNRVYEVITVASEDESNNKCSNECSSETKISTNKEKTDDDILFVSTESNMKPGNLKYFSSDIQQESEVSVNNGLKLELRKIKGMNYSAVNEQDIPCVHSFPSFVIDLSSSDHDKNSNNCTSSDNVIQFGSGNDASSENSNVEIPWKKDVMLMWNEFDKLVTDVIRLLPVRP